MNHRHLDCHYSQWKTIYCLVLTALLAACQSGGGLGSAQDFKELSSGDGLCHGPHSVKNCNGLICDTLTGECVECLSSVNCKAPAAPICSNNHCVPCSEKNACDVGFCAATGECVQCLADNDCEHANCIQNMCVQCNAINCLGTCVQGKCIGKQMSAPCSGPNCGAESPTRFDEIDISTRDLANRIRILHVDVADVASTEVAPFVQAYSVDAKVNGMYATVKTEFVIFNPNRRVMEGELEFPLPDDAVVSGYAIDINGIMTDAQVVEKKKARMAYENEVKKGIDPGLVEQIKGNAYRTRIYPIPAQGGRRVRVEYTTPLMIAPNGDAALALPMPDTKLTQRDITISVVAQGIPAPAVGGLGDKRFTSAQAVWVVESHDTDVKPGENVLVAMPNMPDTIVSTENFKGDTFFVASVKSSHDAVVRSMPKKFRMIWDASGSRSAEDVAKARQLIEHLPENASFELHVFRNVLEPVQNISGRAKLLSVIDALVYDGGTDFASLESLASKKFDGMTLFFTDGMDTMTNALPQFGSDSVAIMSGAARDVSAMRRICGGRIVNLDIASGDDAVAQILKVPQMASDLKGDGIMNVEGIGMPTAGRITLVGRIDPNAKDASMIMSDGRTVSIAFPAEKEVEGKTLATAWAARRVDALSPKAEENRDELLALGRRFSIVSPVSSMLVLENLDQWLEYDIEPPANSPLRAAWLANRKSDAERAEEKEENDKAWREELSDLWDMRVAWYQSPKVRKAPHTSMKRSKQSGSDFAIDSMDDDVFNGYIINSDERMHDLEDSAENPNPYRSSSNERLRDYCQSGWEMMDSCDDCRFGIGGYAEPAASAPTPAASRPRAPMMMDGGYVSESSSPVPSASNRAAGQAAPIVQGSRGLRLDEIWGHLEDEPTQNRRAVIRNSEPAYARPRHSHAPSFVEEASTRDAEGNVDGGVEIQSWDPDTPYLDAIKDVQKIYKSTDSLYKEYLNQRKEYANSPAFYLDCAHLFFKEKQDKLALRILSNLSELKIDDVSLLRVYAWRLREAGDYDDAIILLRKVANLRPDESNSWRDLAMTLTMRAKKNKNAKDAQEAIELYHKVIFTSWNNQSYRNKEDMLYIAVIALEEFNELAEWCKRQGWVGKSIKIPATDPKYLKNFESDLRIVVAWDADYTDIDLMITEPSNQEIYYGRKCSSTGGILSYDIIDGYGPEEYIHKYAPKGKYTVYTKYFASHEQSLIGAATVTVTFYSNWGRSNQKSETVTFRLNEEKDKIKVGEYLLK